MSGREKSRPHYHMNNKPFLHIRRMMSVDHKHVLILDYEPNDWYAKNGGQPRPYTHYRCICEHCHKFIRRCDVFYGAKCPHCQKDL